jgi:hypothetical protein
MEALETMGFVFGGVRFVKTHKNLKKEGDS